MIVYLDTSAIVKRYIVENGSDIVNELYEKCLNGDLILSFSIWNIGETIGVFDKYYRRGWITREDYENVTLKFKIETRRLIKLKLLKIVPVKSSLLVKTWPLMIKYHVYEADALQIVSAKTLNARLVTGDNMLNNIAVREGLDTLYLGEN